MPQTSELITAAAMNVAVVLRTFEHHRRGLSHRLTGAIGAWTGFTELTVDARAPRLAGVRAELLVTTTMRQASASTSVFELIVQDVADPERSILVRGRGVAVYPSLAEAAKGSPPLRSEVRIAG